jgi:hypothetical protein
MTTKDTGNFAQQPGELSLDEVKAMKTKIRESRNEDSNRLLPSNR